MKYLNILPVACILLLFSGCLKNYINIENIENPAGDNGGNDIKPDGKSYVVNFYGNVLPVISKSSTPIQSDRYVDVYAYQYSSTFVTSVAYESLSEGLLSPLRTPMSLPKGVYEFYSFGIANRSMMPPKFKNTEYGTLDGQALMNGIDYIMGSQSDTITGNSNLIINFNHICSQVMVEIAVANTSIVIDSIKSATISQPDTTNQLVTLFTGKVSYAKKLLSEPVRMNINKLVCHQILLPLRYSGSLKMNFVAYFKNIPEPISYSLSVPLVNGMLEAGNSYLFKAVIDGNNINVVNAEIKNWTEVDETGTPIYPHIN